MSRALKFDPRAQKELEKLDKAVQRSVLKYLSECCTLQDPAARGHSLTGPFAG